ncbi:MAG: hypothetical protein AAGD96_28535 [Chloroflexota bacterium]
MKKYLSNNITPSAILAFVILAAVSWNCISRKINSKKFDGIWARFESSDHFTPDEFPQNLAFDYPKFWSLSVYDNVAAKPALKYRKIALRNPNYVFRSTENINIWWAKAETNWTQENLVDWYIESISTDSRDNDLTTNSFNNVEIGVNNQTALKTNGKGWQKTIFLVSVNQDAYAIIYSVDSSRNYSKDILDRFIDSIDFSSE